MYKHCSMCGDPTTYFMVKDDKIICHECQAKPSTQAIYIIPHDLEPIKQMLRFEGNLADEYNKNTHEIMRDALLEVIDAVQELQGISHLEK